MGALKGVGVAAALSALPALGALVPMMAGAGLAAGTLKLGFAGVGDALEQAGKDQKKYEEALKKLSPAQRAFTKAVVGLKKEFAPIGREVQKAMLPGFTRAVKDAGPVVKILGKHMTEMGEAFGDAAEGVGRMLKDSGFQDDLQANLKLGSQFVREMTSSLGPFTRSLLDFGAASGPTLRAFSDGIGGLLSKGLPSMFSGLRAGIPGAAKMLDGLFSAIDDVLGGLGRLSGEVARDLGPVFGEQFALSGSIVTGAMDAIRGAMVLLRPVFKDITFGLKSVRDIAAIIGPTLRDTGLAIFSAFAPVGDSVNGAVGPLQRLNQAIAANKIGILEGARQFGNAVIDMTSAAITAAPTIIHAFTLVSGGILSALSGVAHGAALAFGWVPGIGGKLKAADKAFGDFKDSYIEGLTTAESKASHFAASTAPKLAAGKLKLNINNWSDQLAEAKRKLATVPPSKQSALKATIKDLEAKIRSARGQLDSLDGKTATTYVKTVYEKVEAQNAPKFRARGGPIKLAAGGNPSGLVRGPGTGTSDSIPAMLSNGEYVIRAKSVAKYGMAFLNAVNQGSLGISRLASGGLAGSEVANGLASGMTNGMSKVNDAARVMAAAVEAGVRTELQIASPSKKMQALAKEIGAGLIKGLTGSRDQIKSTSASLAKSIWATFSGSTDNRLVATLNQQTKKLLDLAAKRDKVASSLAAGQQMAKDQKAAGLSFASMTSLPNGGNTFDAGGILSGLKVRLGQLKTFSGNVAKLAKMGLSKDLIGQIIAAGPDGGAAYAAALVKATPDQLKALNSAQSQIAKVSSSYGNSAADIMYDAGSQAGKGFLTGLKAQQKAIENSMSDLAKKIQAAIKKALKIKSPSRVMAEIGEHVGQGLVMGMDATHAAIVSSSNRMATAVQRGVATEPAQRAEQGRTVIFNAHTTDKPTRQTVMDALRDSHALYSPLVA
ncbi:hypothetical protein SAV14893_050580 [Streptomyces avermitilis]|nr:hypothetical protein [Streptomyces avermitilis]GDY65665.1 hypothetical protein SAV14893_050580 [Streptomyces avermitilis]